MELQVLCMELQVTSPADCSICHSEFSSTNVSSSMTPKLFADNTNTFLEANVIN